MAEVFSPEVVARLRRETGYNPRQRLARAYRLLVVSVEAYLLGQSLCFAALRACFLKRYGSIRPRAFQLRFKSATAAAFFGAAFMMLVRVVVDSVSLKLEGALAAFDDVRVYDATGQRVPARGRAALPGCTKGHAGAKLVLGYSLKTGLVEEATLGAETSRDTHLWRQLVPELKPRVLYLLDLAFFERALFQEALRTGAHLVMRLKRGARLTVLGHLHGRRHVRLDAWSLAKYLRDHPRGRGTTYDLDVRWGKGKTAVELRLVGVSLGGRKGLRFYLTTVSRATMSAAELVETYRLRWLIEFLFREMKQSADIGRSATADRNALRALTYGAMMGHVVVRSLRLTAAMRHHVPLEQLRPLACLHVLRPFAVQVADALLSFDATDWARLVADISALIVTFSREVKPSRRRSRIASHLGAIGG